MLYGYKQNQKCMIHQSGDDNTSIIVGKQLGFTKEEITVLGIVFKFSKMTT